MPKKSAKKNTKATRASNGMSADKFDSKAVKLYKAGKKVADIAVALGYERGTGQNRVRNALMKAGIYKGRAAATTAKAGKQELNVPIPNDPETLLKQAFQFAAVRYHKVPDAQRMDWAQRLSGMILADLGAKQTRRISPVAVPRGFKVVSRAAAA